MTPFRARISALIGQEFGIPGPTVASIRQWAEQHPDLWLWAVMLLWGLHTLAGDCDEELEQAFRALSPHAPQGVRRLHDRLLVAWLENEANQALRRAQDGDEG